ncbi:hypothetical protein [Chryseobacterium sp. 3008163]|uniref:hypothetical protein n=1 Tax=Chryseobacterium sp. 3008163 TaxID=2478663 RepID=UPI001013C665|nr:hypothetical protein [Chryseobacterium sp. 3008163]
MKKAIFILVCFITLSSFTSKEIQTKELPSNSHFTFGKVSKQKVQLKKEMKYIEFTTSCGIPCWAEYDTDYYNENDVIDIMLYVDEYFCGE